MQFPVMSPQLEDRTLHSLAFRLFPALPSLRLAWESIAGAVQMLPVSRAISQSLEDRGKQVRSPGLVVRICDFGQLNLEVWRTCSNSGNSFEESKT